MIDQYISQYGKRLYGLCLTLCANTSDAEDLYQDTWLKVWRHIAKYDATKAFEPWLTRICVNTYRNSLRKIVRSPIFTSLSGNTKDEMAFLSPEREDYSELQEAIARLPEKCRVTVILFYFRDMDLNAAAQALGIPVGTVKSRLNKSRKLLKEALKYAANIPF